MLYLRSKFLPVSYNRRTFIRSASLLAALSITDMETFAGKRHMETQDKSIAEDDEKYWSSIRDFFPLTKELTYLNNGTMGPSPYPVIEAVHTAMADCDKQMHYGGWEATSAKLAGFLGASEEEIALTHNVTEGINIACWGLPLKRKDEVIITTHEHVGNALPWLNRMRLHGIVIKTFIPAPTADETLERIGALINKRTKVIAVPHIPCTQGQILPIKEICMLAREKGIYSVVDGAHGPGMLVMDLHDMGCDTYAGCCHKWMLGPKGTGFLYVRKGFWDTLQPYFVGGGSGGKTDWDVLSDPINPGDFAASAHRYYGGTQSTALYKGVEASVDFLDGIGMANVSRRVRYLGKYAQDSLLALGDRIQLLTPTEERSRAGVNGFKVKGMSSEELYKKLAEERIRIRLVPENGLNSLRVSTHIYNNPAEIDALTEVLRKALA